MRATVQYWHTYLFGNAPSRANAVPQTAPLSTPGPHDIDMLEFEREMAEERLQTSEAGRSGPSEFEFDTIFDDAMEITARTSRSTLPPSSPPPPTIDLPLVDIPLPAVNPITVVPVPTTEPPAPTAIATTTSGRSSGRSRKDVDYIQSSDDEDMVQKPKGRRVVVPKPKKVAAASKKAKRRS